MHFGSRGGAGAPLGFLLSASLILSASLTFSAGAAYAQSAEDESIVLDPIVVEDGSPQASRRPARPASASRAAPAVAEPLQEPAPVGTIAEDYNATRDFPSSLTILDQSLLEQENVRDLRDLSGTSPNFTAFDGGGNRMTQFSVRGIREPNYQSAPEILPSVAYYFDDVPALTSLSRVSLFNNLDSVTIKKGPQNSDYGFSRAGGVIDVRTPEPSRIATAYGTAGFGNYDAYELSAGFSTPLVQDKLYASGDIIKDTRDGFYDNVATGEPYGDKDALGGRLKLTARASDTTTIDFGLRYEKFRDQADPYILDPLNNPDPFKVDFDRPGHENIDQDMQYLRVRSEFDRFDFMSVTAHQGSSWSYRADASQYGAPYADFIGTTDEDIDTYSQEFRVASNNAANQIGWKGGLFLARTTMDYEGGFLFNDGTPAGPPTIAETTSNDVSGFGEVTVPLTSALRLGAGLRYDWAGRKGSNEFAPPSITRGDEDYSAFSPSVSLLYGANPNVSYFAKYARGFKPGGFNARTSTFSPFAFEYDAETSDNFELGVKTLMLGGKLGLGGSVFYSKFHDYQNLTQLSPSTFGLSNAQSARSYGVELESAYQITRAVKLFANFGYTNAEYDDFRSPLGNFSGNTISYVPEFTAAYGTEYETESGFYFLGQARTTGSYYLDDTNTAEQGTYTLVDLAAGYRVGRLDASLFVSNLTDQEYVVNSFGFAGPGADMGTIGDPRTYGMRAKMTF
ncbi:TonB-dependent receptor [Methyloligella sp. 2.7D]|uniref:TonB-dependent receptor n=1 Tax=unclassified Methyloligella TaxID=2625955 RepID=UPI00157D8063|nr:TonB-dependent receptor [Methyloligella sp. GL2]QKP76967.1 TonB-dependent receptor [Methyloligella sp. GL2]